jgi:UDP-N-acetylglucosamine--N-acetylmuramyl-(pentapeptide) pyrophosphoryl-undecaprenol N-acetylglucosamine transferase
MRRRNSNLVAIACGGTGGHLFPGVAVGHELVRKGCEVTLLVSPKEVDQQAVKYVVGMDVETLPAVALQDRKYWRFAAGFGKALAASLKLLRQKRPGAVLAMGGFTSAPPVVAGRILGAKTFLHESNAIPGRANRFLAPIVSRAFVGFSEAGNQLKTRRITVTGTPVREQFQSVITETCRRVMGLQPDRPTLLIMGGSQGARGVNELAMSALPALREQRSDLQFLWLAGNQDVARVREFCRAGGHPVVVRKFLPEMELAYGAATVAVARSGASTLSELAAMRVPSILIPLPGSADNHQHHNALNFEQTGAARLLKQGTATPEKFGDWVDGLIADEAARAAMQVALEQWHHRDAAAVIASNILQELGHSNASDNSNRSGDNDNLEPMQAALRLAVQ